MQKADFSNWGDPNAEAIKKDPIGRPAAPSFSGRQGGVFSFVAFVASVWDSLVVSVIAFAMAFGCPCTAIRQRRRDDGKTGLGRRKAGEMLVDVGGAAESL